MFVKALADCPEFLAGDHTVLREILHPAKEALALGHSLAHARLGPGLASTPHRLASSEVYVLVAGRGRMTIDGEERDVMAGDTIYIPPHATQHIRNLGEEALVFFCLVEPAWRPEDEEVL